LTKDPVLVEQRLFPTGNPNINGTGALDFSGNRLYALDSNNGILAFTVKKPTPKPPIQPVLSDPRLVAAGQFQCTLTGESGRAYVLETSADLVNWTPISTNIASSAIITITAPAATGVDYQFYRAAVEP
jgi:outer membrane protein assembly factor BamB